jgi:hypothetical protein
MNEKIKQLAEQATTYIEPTSTSGEGWIFNKEKFAELIIRECADIVENQGRFLRYDVLAKKIKENFEIKNER